MSCFLTAVPSWDSPSTAVTPPLCSCHSEGAAGCPLVALGTQDIPFHRLEEGCASPHGVQPQAPVFSSHIWTPGWLSSHSLECQWQGRWAGGEGLPRGLGHPRLMSPPVPLHCDGWEVTAGCCTSMAVSPPPPVFSKLWFDHQPM